MVFKPGQRTKTRAGSPVRIYAIDGGGTHGVHGAWFNELEDLWIPCSWSADGFFVDKDYPRSLDISQYALQVEV